MNYIFRTPPLIDFKNNRNTLFLLPSHITLTTQRRLHSFLVWDKFTKVSSFVGNHSIQLCLVITGYCPSETNIRHLKGRFFPKVHVAFMWWWDLQSWDHLQRFKHVLPSENDRISSLCGHFLTVKGSVTTNHNWSIKEICLNFLTTMKLNKV